MGLLFIIKPYNNILCVFQNNRPYYCRYFSSKMIYLQIYNLFFNN